MYQRVSIPIRETQAKDVHDESEKNRTEQEPETSQKAKREKAVTTLCMSRQLCWEDSEKQNREKERRSRQHHIFPTPHPTKPDFPERAAAADEPEK